MSENPSVEVATSHWLRVGDEKNCDTLLAAAAHFILQVYPDEHLLWEASIVCEQDDDESSETAAYCFAFRTRAEESGARPFHQIGVAFAKTTITLLDISQKTFYLFAITKGTQFSLSLRHISHSHQDLFQIYFTNIIFQLLSR